MTDPIRVVWDTHDFYFAEDVYIGFPFDLTILSDDENPPTAQLTIQNVDPRIGDTIRALTSPPRLKIQLSLSSNFTYSLLLHFDGADGSQTFVDSGGHNVSVTAHNHVQIDSAQRVFGSGSALFDGVDDYLTVAANPLFQFGTDDFTVDFRFRIPTTGIYVFYDTNSAMNIRLETDVALLDENSLPLLDENSLAISSSIGPNVAVMAGADYVMFGTTPITADTWYHLEIARDGSFIRMFLNGDLEDGAPDFTDITGTSPVIGRNNSGANQYFNGWLEELRVIKGIPAHTGAFSMPLGPYVPSYADNPDIIYSADKLFLVNVSVDVMQITGNIVGWDYLQRVWPGPRAMQSVFPGLFR